MAQIRIHNGVCHIDGMEYPTIGFGTYPLRDETCRHAVQEACALGYRILDTATLYKNFKPIGQALKASGIPREDIYLISKVWPDSQTSDRLNRDIQATLAELQVDYIDAYLIHWPNHKIPIEDTLAAMAALKEKQLIHHIGLSNITVNHLRRIQDLDIAIDWVQVEMHPLFYDTELTHYCQQNAIGVQAWAPLARGRLREDPLLTELAARYQKTPEQIALRWIVQNECIPLPGSQNPKHMQQNLQIADFTLSADEIMTINARAAVGERQRITLAKGLGFADEFDFSGNDCWP